MAPRRKDYIVDDDSTSPKHLSQISPIERFFGGYVNFQYDPSKSIAGEYQNLRRLYGWKRGDHEGEMAWSGYRLALVKEFNRLFGTDSQDLLAWQSLCMFVGVEDIFTTSEDCRRSLEGQHFNVVDVIDARRRGDGAAQIFPTNEGLQEYTRRTGSHFPHGHPKAGHLLRMVLRRPRDLQEKIDEARNKEFPTSSSKKEARSRKQNRIVAEALETTNIYP